MTQLQVVLCVLLCLVFGSLARASEEEFLVWNEVQITSHERKDTGKVVFTAKMNGAAFKSVSIEAFGKSHVVPSEMLASLSGFPLSSLTTTHEAGYERLGGHTVSFKFKRVETASGRPIEHKVTLSVSSNTVGEDGRGLALTGPSEKLLEPAN